VAVVLMLEVVMVVVVLMLEVVMVVVVLMLEVVMVVGGWVCHLNDFLARSQAQL
jgi:hypothetical protein